MSNAETGGNTGEAVTGGEPSTGGNGPAATGGNGTDGSGGTASGGATTGGLPSTGGSLATGGDGGIGGGGTGGSGGRDTGGSGGNDSAGSAGFGDEETAGSAGSATGGGPGLEHFSFFVTSLEAMRRLSGSQNGFGGDLRYGEETGLAGADKICAEIAEFSMAGSGAKGWRAFLSTTTVDAIDRVGEGPWYDRLGRVLALTKADLLYVRPASADPEIINDLPNEYGVPNQDPDGTGDVDNHDFLTGSDAEGRLYAGPDSNCNDWTSLEPELRPRVGHSWPFGGVPPGGHVLPADPMAHWISALDENGCAPGVNLDFSSSPEGTVGGGGGYGGFYCFALQP